ncbi:MAG: hypothetical protein G01um101470_623 [Parcubacteria group bacterium Gr01-1014_70]|nr:MAG: hypothetical protein G01um101470_623 [Parcubacteria group bacterium Gr01-1014_70]
MFASALVVLMNAFQKNGTAEAKMREIVERGLLLFGGVLLGILPVFLFVAYYDWERAVQHWFNIYASVGLSLEEKEIVLDSTWLMIYQFFRSWALVFVEQIAVYAGVVFAGFVTYLMGMTQLFFSERRIVRKMLLACIIFVFGGSLLAHSIKIIGIGTFRPYVFLSLIVFLVPLLLWLWHVLIYRDTLRGAMRNNESSLIFLAIWVLSLFIGYSFYIPGYHREFMPAFSLITAFIFMSVPWNSMSQKAILAFACSVIGLFGVGALWFHNPILGWWWRQETIEEVAMYIQARTQPGDMIFTANPLPAILADRRVVADITSYAIYFAVDENSSFGGFPSPRAYFDLLQSNPPSYTLIDGRMKHHFFEKYPFFEEFVKTNYIHVATFGTGHKRDWTEVWELQNH